MAYFLLVDSIEMKNLALKNAEQAYKVHQMKVGWQTLVNSTN